MHFCFFFRKTIKNKHVGEGFIEQAIKCNGHGYVLKESDFDTLSRAIFEVYDKGYYFNEHFNYEKLLKFATHKQIPVNGKGQKEVKLNEREVEFVRLLCDEKTDTEIADIMGLALNTAKSYRKDIMRKVNAKKTIGIIVYAIKQFSLKNQFSYLSNVNIW